jgi:hypothetical protein
MDRLTVVYILGKMKRVMRMVLGPIFVTWFIYGGEFISELNGIGELSIVVRLNARNLAG